jgi:hypothetical protein
MRRCGGRIQRSRIEIAQCAADKLGRQTVRKLRFFISALYGVPSIGSKPASHACRGPAPETPGVLRMEPMGSCLKLETSPRSKCCELKSGRSPFGIAYRSGCPPAEPYPANDVPTLLPIISANRANPL